MFKRNLEKSVITELQRNPLWINHLKADCENGVVFFAIRKDEIGFYHNGGRLFKFDKNGFSTHVKYASVISETDKDYLTETKLKNKDYDLISDFSENYDRIKENCGLYSGVEALGVSEIYNKHSYLSYPKNEIVVLDIEIAFEAMTVGNKLDIIDILLFDTSTQTLKFVEAKHYSNDEIRSDKKAPQVISQINRYEDQIADKKTDILNAYTEYIKIVHTMFNKSLPLPVKVEDKVTLLIFGFDTDQRAGRLNKQVVKNEFYEGYTVYRKGEIKKVVLENLWKQKPL
ncbi:MAG: hypothetical protein LBU83_01570 [Bacteroidales bacterium]|jgi:hypothetical protein|nr:hypothetical protein [Bacteroidales bacterium]